MGVLVSVKDLVLRSRIIATADAEGVAYHYGVGVEEVLRLATQHRPARALLDLGDARVSALDLIVAMKQDSQLASIPIIGFFSHVLARQKKDAIDAGCDRVLPRSVFFTRLPEVLRGEYDR